VGVSCKIQSFKRLKQEREVISAFSKYGTSKSHIQELPIELATRNPEEGLTYWYYSGPLDEKTRPFCKRLLSMDKVFSDEEIKKISDELNYNVLEFVGAYNCRHSWVRFRGKIISTPAPTVREIRKLINDGIEVGR
jgi:hypothetical protein